MPVEVGSEALLRPGSLAAWICRHVSFTFTSGCDLRVLPALLPAASATRSGRALPELCPQPLRHVTHVLHAALRARHHQVVAGADIGRLGGRPILIRFGSHVGLTPERLAKFEAQFRRYGALVVVVARFVVVLRQVNGLIAGSLAMPWPRFVAANAVGALLWSAVWTLGPYFFTELFVSHHRPI